MYEHFGVEVNFTELIERIKGGISFLKANKYEDKERLNGRCLFSYLHCIVGEAELWHLKHVHYIAGVLRDNCDYAGFRYEQFVWCFNEMLDRVVEADKEKHLKRDYTDYISSYRKYFIENNFKLKYQSDISPLEGEVDDFLNYLLQFEGESLREININEVERSLFNITQQSELRGLRELCYITSLLQYNLDKLGISYNTFIVAAYQMKERVKYIKSNRKDTPPEQVISNFRNIFKAKNFIYE